jgi:hypothetical protein
MKINTTLVRLSDAQRLLDAIQKLGYTPPKTLSAVLTAREKLAEAPPIPNPTKGLVAAALDGEDVDKILEQTAIARLVAEERKSLPRVEGELLNEFGRRLDNSGADDLLSLIRPRFDKAANTLRTAQATIDVPADPAAFLNTATGKQLIAYQSIAPAVSELDAVAAVARQLGPSGPFPVVPDPRSIDNSVRCGWLHDVATMCTDSPLITACAEFQKPAPLNDIHASPWLKVSPHLHTIESARERLRVWAEAAWADEEAQRPRGGRLINGVIVDDPPRCNPFAREEAKAS